MAIVPFGEATLAASEGTTRHRERKFGESKCRLLIPTDDAIQPE